MDPYVRLCAGWDISTFEVSGKWIPMCDCVLVGIYLPLRCLSTFPLRWGVWGDLWGVGRLRASGRDTFRVCEPTSRVCETAIPLGCVRPQGM